MAITKENIKENNNLAIAKLNNCPTSPRKMRFESNPKLFLQLALF